MSKNEKPQTKICKHCKTEIPYGAKVCPQCRKKQGVGCLVWVIIIIVALGVIGALAGGGDDSKEEKVKGNTNVKSTENQEKKGETKEADGVEKAIEVLSERYYMRDEENARYFIVLKNNSDIDLSVEANAVAKDNAGNILGAEEEKINSMSSGQEMVLGFYFDDAQNVSDFEYDLNVKESEYAKSYYNDVSIETSVNNDKLIVMLTNNGNEDIDHVMPYALFFNGGELFSHEYSGYVSLGAGESVPVELECFDGAFEEFELYFEAWK